MRKMKKMMMAIAKKMKKKIMEMIVRTHKETKFNLREIKSK